MKKYLEQVYEYIDDHKEEMLETWKKLVSIESYTRDSESVNKAVEYVKELFEASQLKCRTVDVGADSGKTLIGIIGEKREGKPIIFSGHLDTVFPKGSFGEILFKIEDGKAYGPGALDMKGGIVISLYVVRALNHIGFDERPIKIIFSGDEETGHLNSTGAEVIVEEGKGGLCAFNMETALVSNQLCVGRKGRVECHIVVEGVEAHAGNDFPSGRNAIEEMAHKVIDIQKLTDLEKGVTVSVGLIKGGTVSNSVPANCEVSIDIRYEKIEDSVLIKEKIEAICSKCVVDGTVAKADYPTAIAAYETTENVMKFHEFVNEVSQKHGFGEMGHKKLGGGSDAAYLTIAGTPTLCSFGVRGEWNHTLREYALVDTLFERAKLISTIILELKNFNL